MRNLIVFLFMLVRSINDILDFISNMKDLWNLYHEKRTRDIVTIVAYVLIVVHIGAIIVVRAFSVYMFIDTVFPLSLC